MAIIDFVKWNGDTSILAWRFPSQELSTWTQLVVNETQEAYLVKEGVYEGPFKAGRHTLTTNNIPLLTELIGIPFGGQSPFAAEVWFVNRTTRLDIKWGTPDPIQLQDPKFKLMAPVRVYGQYGIRVGDAKTFLQKLVGTLPAFDTDTLANYFKGVFTTRIKSAVTQAIIKTGHSVLEISAYLDELSAALKEALAPSMAEYGIELVQLNILSVNMPEDDPAVVALKKMLAKRAEMDVLGFNYQQERSFDVLQTAASNEGNAGAVMSAGLGLGMGASVGGALGQIAPILQTGGPGTGTAAPGTGMGMGVGVPVPGMPGAAPAATVNCPACQAANPADSRFCARCGGALAAPAAAAPQQQSTTCDRCGGAIPPGAKFCPHCADEVNPCPACGQDNAKGAATCRRCGAPLPVSCANCGTALAAGAKFCSNCGTSAAAPTAAAPAGNKCSQCGADIAADAKFCAACGQAM